MAIAEPVTPAINAWLSLVGMPNFHAATAQITMDANPEQSAVIAGFPLSAEGAGLKLAILYNVSATLPLINVITSVPRKLKTAAIAIAERGDIDFADMHAAMELGASVQPLTNITAKTKTIAKNN